MPVERKDTKQWVTIDNDQEENIIRPILYEMQVTQPEWVENDPKWFDQ